MSLFNKYKTAILFVARFVGLYIVLNLLYAVYVESYNPHPDPVTEVVTRQTSVVLNLFGHSTRTSPDLLKPNVNLSNEDGSILSVYEGCNGLNVMIIFLAFLIAYKPSKSLLWFIPLGLLLIHLTNILRIYLLYIVSLNFPSYYYFSHKYLFTAAIFATTFALWYWWVKQRSK